MRPRIEVDFIDKLPFNYKMYLDEKDFDGEYSYFVYAMCLDPVGKLFEEMVERSSEYKEAERKHFEFMRHIAATYGTGRPPTEYPTDKIGESLQKLWQPLDALGEGARRCSEYPEHILTLERMERILSGYFGPPIKPRDSPVNEAELEFWTPFLNHFDGIGSIIAGMLGARHSKPDLWDNQSLYGIREEGDTIIELATVRPWLDLRQATIFITGAYKYVETTVEATPQELVGSLF